MIHYDDVEKGCKWSFQRWNKSMTYFGPNDAIIQSFNRDFYESLVRESIQNSLDAVLEKGKPVKVSYSFDKVNIDDFPKLFRLKEHIQGCLDTHSDTNRAKELYEPMLRYLPTTIHSSLDLITVSDSNTTGMQYNPEDPKNAFSAFTKSVGLSQKTTTDSGGSYGFGKAAYFQMSPLRAILVSTRTPDGHCYFEGVTRLCTHKVQGVEYVDMGYYDSKEGIPAEDNEIPDKFKRETAGTSISLVGKYADSGNRQNMENELLKSVLRNFWLAIDEEKLVVTIGRSYMITKQELSRLITSTFTLNAKDKNNPRPYFEAYTHTEDNLHLRFTGETRHLGEVFLYVCINPQVKRDRIAYMRNLMMLVETKSLSSSYGLNALFLCLNQKGNEILSSIEDASHTSWSTKGKTGEAAKLASETLTEIDSFVQEKIGEAFNNGGDIEVIDIGIGFSEEDIENLLADKSEINNPFGTTRTGRIVEEGGELTTVHTETTQKPKIQEPKGNIGKVVKGQKSSGSVAVKKTIGTGHTAHKSKTKGGAGTGGRIQTVDTPEVTGTGQKFVLYTPVSYHAPAYKKDGEWFHDLILHNEEAVDDVFIEVKIGTEEGEDSVQISSCSPIGKLSGDKGIIKFTHLDAGKITLTIQFADKQRHSIKLR
jgi:hypothetical protein